MKLFLFFITCMAFNIANLTASDQPYSSTIFTTEEIRLLKNLKPLEDHYEKIAAQQQRLRPEALATAAGMTWILYNALSHKKQSALSCAALLLPICTIVAESLYAIHIHQNHSTKLDRICKNIPQEDLPKYQQLAKRFRLQEPGHPYYGALMSCVDIQYAILLGVNNSRFS